MGERIQQNALNAIDRGETQFAGRIEAYLMDLGNHVATVLAGQKAAGDVDIPEGYQQKLTDELTALWTDTMKKAFADSAGVMGMDIAWDVANPRVQDTIGGLAERVVMIDDSTKNMIRAAVARQTREGRTMDQLAADIRAGNTEAFSKSRAVTIARTESAVAYNNAAILAYREVGVEKVEVMDGDYDAECFVPRTLVQSGAIEQGMMRSFDGDVFTLSTATGEQLTCTGEHPILTDRGWITARELMNGDNLFRCLDLDRMLTVLGADSPYNDNMPTPIEDVVQTFTIERSCSPHHIQIAGNLDGNRRHANITVIPSDSLLRNGIHRGKQISEQALVIAARLSASLAAHSHSDQLVTGLGPSGSSDIGCRREFLSSIDVKMPHSIGISARAILDSQTGMTEGSDESAGTYPRLISQRGASFAGQITRVQVEKCRSKVSAFGCDSDLQSGFLATNCDASGDEQFACLFGVESKLPPGTLQSLAGLIEPTQLINIKRSFYSGHVYNLTTQTNWYVANGIISHNCRAANGQIWTLDYAMAHSIQHPNCTRCLAPIV
jgi:hypothetical protein